MSGYFAYCGIDDSSDDDCCDDLLWTCRLFITYDDIYTYLIKVGGSTNYLALSRCKRLYKCILYHIPKDVKPTKEDTDKILTFSKKTTKLLSQRYKACKTKKNFYANHGKWLNSEIKWPKCETIDLYKIFKDNKEKVYFDGIKSFTPNTPELTVTENETDITTFKRNNYAFDSNRDLFNFLQNETGNCKDFQLLEQYILNQLPFEIAPEDREAITDFAKKFSKQAHAKYASCKRNDSWFNKAYRVWLDNDVQWPDCITVDLSTVFDKYRVRPKGYKSPRPDSDFEKVVKPTAFNEYTDDLPLNTWTYRDLYNLRNKIDKRDERFTRTMIYVKTYAFYNTIKGMSIFHEVYHTFCNKVPFKLTLEDDETIITFICKVLYEIREKIQHYYCICITKSCVDTFNEEHRLWLDSRIKWPIFVDHDLNEIVGNVRKKNANEDKLLKDCSMSELEESLASKLTESKGRLGFSFIVSYLTKNPDAITEVKRFLDAKNK